MTEPLYVDEATGLAVSTHSALKTFRRCPKQAQYKYKERLKPKEVQKALHRGKWVHALLEKYHMGEDWREEHRKWCYQFSKLFDEEKERLGNLPDEILRIMRGYIWHYKADEWEVVDVEFTIETKFPDGSIYRGRVDALIRNQYGLWLVDHKTHARLPDLNFRLLDAQSALYLWAALREKYQVEGFIWNYLRWKAPTIPKLLKSGASLARSASGWDTDYPTLLTAIKSYGLDPADYAERLGYFRGLRYSPGAPQLSTFFRRDTLEKSPAMLKRVAQENYHTAKRMHSYDFDNVDAVERVVDRSCTFTCSYTGLCTTELMGGNADFMRRKLYTIGDPMDYYKDEKEVSSNE